MSSYAVAASDVAALCGMHRYRSLDETLVAFWKTNAPDLYERLRTRDPENVMHWRARASRVATTEQLHAAANDDAQLDALVRTVKATSKDAQRDASAVVSAVYSRRGTLGEAEGVDRYEASSTIPVTERNAQLLTLQIQTPAKPLICRGRVDGLQDGCVVEHKKRQKRLFHTVPEYERVQCHVYMRMTGADHAKLVETHDAEQCVHDIPFDEELWASIVDALSRFVQSNVSFLAEAGEDETVAQAVRRFQSVVRQQPGDVSRST